MLTPPLTGEALAQSLAERAESLGWTPQGDQLYCLTRPTHTDPLLQTLGYLREQAFRAVGEGSGHPCDLDRFDPLYDHLILWSPRHQTIIGAYRVAPVRRLVTKDDWHDLYSASLFTWPASLTTPLMAALEMGRSFIQPAFWRQPHALDALWRGIGTYLKREGALQYLFGPVSLSRAWPAEAIALIVLFYQCQFPARFDGVRARHPYPLPETIRHHWTPIFSRPYRPALTALRQALKPFGLRPPPLFRHYTEMAGPAGAQFLAFGEDPAFNTIDGLLLADLKAFPARRKARYFQPLLPHPPTVETAPAP